MDRPTDEVVQVFTGDTLEEAMAYAVATLGPDLAVRRARKVRKGLQGLTGKDRYEVVALAPTAAGQDRDAVGSAFEALLAQAEEVESVRGSAPAPGAATSPAPAAPRAARAAAPAGARPEVPAPRAAVVPVPALAAPEPPMPAQPSPSAPSRRAQQRTRAAARPPARTPARTAARTRPAKPVTADAPTGWSRAALVAAGLPRPVLAALPARDPRDDAGWISALTRAIATVLPPAAPLDAEHPVTVSGHGLAGVVGILRAAGKGLPPGTIAYDGRTAPATATELALAVRAEVLR